MTPTKLDDNKKLSTPMSLKRAMVPIAVLVCNVESTKWPVRLAWTAISAVYLSRISPTMTTSGSCLSIARNPLEKVKPTFESTCVWLTP